MRNESGATAIEYGLIIALLTVGLFIVFPLIKEPLKTTFTELLFQLNGQTTVIIDDKDR